MLPTPYSRNPTPVIGPVVMLALLVGQCLGLLLLVGCLRPDVGPGPDVIPVTPVTPVEPLDPSGLKVLVLYESDDLGKLPPAQVHAIQSRKVRAWLDSHQADYRIWDQHTDTTHSPDFWRQAMKLPRERLPWIWISDAKSSRDGPLPANTDAVLQLLDSTLK